MLPFTRTCRRQCWENCGIVQRLSFFLLHKGRGAEEKNMPKKKKESIKDPSPAAETAAARSHSMYEDHPHGLAVPGSRPVHQDPHRQRQWQNSRAWVPESVPTSSLQSFYTARSLYNTGAWPIPSSPSATRYPWSRQQPGLLVDTGLSKSPTSYISDDYYEVVLDDGTRQKRSVSLSTLPPTPGVKMSNDWRDTYFYHQGQRNGSA